MRTVFLVGFDRSGTSFVAGMLERHPRVQYFCQPDNSSPLHRAQWEYWGAGDGDAASNRFRDALAAGRVDRDYVVSDWFRRFGCGEWELSRDAVNVIKSTKLHWKVRWLERVPAFEILAVLRDPRAAVASLVRNGFHEKWYGPADYRAARERVTSGDLPDTGLDLSPPGESPSSVAAVAWLLLVRTAVLCADLDWDERRLLFYERARERPSGYLCSMLALPPHDLDAAREQDFNIIGRPFEGEYRGWADLDAAARGEIQAVLGALCRRLGYPDEVPV